jgi:hypothetical protein
MNSATKMTDFVLWNTTNVLIKNSSLGVVPCNQKRTFVDKNVDSGSKARCSNTIEEKSD